MRAARQAEFPSIAGLAQKSSRKLPATEDSRVLPALSLLLLLPLQKVKKGSSRLGSAQNIRPQGLRTSPLSVDFDLDVEVEWIFFVEYRPRVPGRGQQPRLGQRRVGTPPRRAPRCKNGFGPVLLYWFPIKIRQATGAISKATPHQHKHECEYKHVYVLSTVGGQNNRGNGWTNKSTYLCWGN